MTPQAPPDANALRELFDHDRAASFGAEEEVMLLDPDSLDLCDRASELLNELRERDGFKLELPASQLEIVSPPCSRIDALAEHLRAGRARLLDGLAGGVRVAAAGVHPFAAAEGALNTGDRYEQIEREYRSAVRRQLVCGLHVHVGLAGSDRVLAVYNALRGHLPDLAALGANAPIHLGRDSGMASVRPSITTALPRQGVPPAFASWENYAAALAWAAHSGRLRNVREWWWELRLHPALGTIEMRVPDAQSLPADAAALIATASALVLWLAARHDAADLPPVASSWRIAENRWSAARHGIHGGMADLQTGRTQDTGDRLHRLLDELEPFAASVAGAEQLSHAHLLADSNGADRQRMLARDLGLPGLVSVLSDSFADPMQENELPRAGAGAQ
jgi:carboxylate-amine ligase